MRVPRTGGKRNLDRMHRAAGIVAPPNQLMVVIHAMPGDDGCEPIVSYLRAYRDTLSRTNPVTNLTLETGRKFVIEGEYGKTAAEIVADHGIPPQFVTHVLLLVPGMNGMYDTIMDDLPAILHRNQPTAFGIGRIDLFDPEAKDLRRFNELPDVSRRLVSYFESYHDRAVLFIGTGPYTVIDRSIGYAPGA